MFGKFTRTNISAFLACTLLFAGVAMLVPSFAQAAPGINPEIPFHGVLKDDLGDPLSGSYDMTFVIYDAPTGGTALWTGLYTVTVTDGTFKVMLGSGGSTFGALDFTDDTYYIGLTVEADAEMTPRQRIGASAYAFNADKLDGYDSTDFLNLSASTSMATTSATTLFTLTQNGAGDILNLFSGATEVFTVLASGNVGIGTTSANASLEVGRNSSGVSGIFDVGAGAIPFAFGWADNTQYHRLRSAGAANDNIILELVNPSTHYLSIGGLLNTVYGASIGYGAGSVTPPNLGLLVNGNVGIGTTTPTSLLSVAGDARIGGLLTTGTLTATGTVTFSALSDGCLSTASGIVTSSGSACGSGGGGASNWTFNGTYLTPSSTVGIGVFASSTIGGGTDTTGLTIYGGATTTGRAYFAGNVGIGTPSPSVQLHIMSTTTDAIQWTQSTSSTNQSIVLAANENASQYAYLAQHGSSYAGTMDGISRAGLSLLAFNGTNALIRSVGTAPMIFSTNGAERMRITSAGYVGIGTTTPTNPLTVEGNVKIGDELTLGLTGAINTGAGTFYMRKTDSDYPEYQPVLYLQDMNFAGQAMGFGLTTDGTSEGTSLNIKQSFGDTVATFTDTGNLGVGSSSPNAILTVANTINTTANTPLLTIASTTGGTSTSTLFSISANGQILMGKNAMTDPTFFPDSSSVIVSYTSTNPLGYPTDVPIAFNTYMKAAPASDSDANYRAGYFEVDLTGAVNYSQSGTAVSAGATANTTGTIASLGTFDSSVYNASASSIGALSSYSSYIESDTGTTTDMYGFYHGIALYGGTTTNSYGAYLYDAFVDSAHLTNQYGLYIEDQTAGAVENYAIYSAGGKSYFAGNLGLGTTTPNQLLSVAGSMHLTGALYDRTYSPGSANMILKTTASGVEWVATSTLFSAGGSSNWTDNGTYLSTLTGGDGISVMGSSTIGGGTNTTGLTVYGGATTTGNAYFGGKISIGTTTPFAGALSISTSSASTASAAGALVAYGYQTTANIAPYLGIVSSPRYTAGAGNTLYQLTGMYSDPINNGGGTITSMYGSVMSPNNQVGTAEIMGGYFSLPENSSSNTTTEMYGFISEPKNSGSGTTTLMVNYFSDCWSTGTGIVDTCIGLYLDYEPTQANKFNNMIGVYQTNPDAMNYFYGNVGVGTSTPPWARLTVTGTRGANTTLFEVASTTGTGGAIATSSIFRVGADGNVSIGTTTYAYNPVLSVAGDSAYSSGYNAVIGVKGYQTTANASGYYIGIGSEPVYTAGAGNSLFTLTGEFMNPTNVGGGHIDALYGSIATPKNILGTASTTAGYFSIPENASASTVDWMYGFVSEPMHSGSGTTTLMVNYFSDCWNTGTGMVDTCVGLYLDFEPTQAHKFNNMYGIFQGNPVARNDFFGTVALDGNGYGIGSSPAPYARFSVTGRYGSTTPLFDVASTTGIGPLATSSLFRVNYDGKIGIGTTTPVSALTFASSTSASGGITMGDVTLYRSDTNVLATEDSLVVLGATFGIAGFYGNLTGGTAVGGDLTIDSTANSTKGDIYLNPTGGLVGIGTTTPTEELTVVGFIQSTELLGGIASLETDASGNIIRTPSDERLKENIEPLENSLEKLLELRGVSYEWKDEERFGDQKEIGFIAQEVDLVLPEVVQKGGEYWSLNKANMLAVVVEAVKEIYAKVEEYFARTEALEAENVELKARIEALEDEVGITPEPVPETTGGGSQEPIPEEPMQETPGEGETPAENQPSDTPAEGTIVEEQILAEEPVAEEPLPVDEPVAEPAPEPAPEETPSEPEPVVTEPVL